MKSLLYIDGESSVLNAGFDEEIYNLYKEKQINGLKGYPSGTSKYQFWDVLDAFMKMHAGVKKINNNIIDVSNEILTAALKQYCANFKDQFPNVSLSAVFTKNLTHGCATLVRCFQENAVTRPMMRDGAIKMGQHVNESVQAPYQLPGLPRTTIDTRRMLSLCNSPISDNELANLELHLPELVHHFNAHGYCNDKVMDDLNIMKLTNHASRDDLIVSRKGPLLFTHSEQLDDFNIYKIGRSPLEIARKKTAAAAQAVLDRETKKTNTAAQKMIAKEEEKIRLAGLSKHERSVEVLFSSKKLLLNGNAMRKLKNIENS